MLGDIDGRASILPSDRQSLQHPEHDEKYWRSESDAFVAGKKTNSGGRAAHQQQCRQECELPSDKIAKPPKEKRAQGTNSEPDGEGRQSFQEIGGRASGGI